MRNAKAGISSRRTGIFEGDPLDSEQMIADLTKLRQRGATHLVFTANTIWWLDYYPEFAEHLYSTAVISEGDKPNSHSSN